MKLLFPLIALIAAIAIFFSFTNSHYQNMRILQAQQAEFNEALQKSQDLIALRDKLQEARKALPQSELDRLATFLPDHIDNIRLILDISNIASRYGMQLNRVQLGQPDAGAEKSAAAAAGPFHFIDLTFSVTGSYQTFIQFIADLESSLRLVDVVKVSFRSSKNSLSEHTLTVRTYWLK